MGRERDGEVGEEGFKVCGGGGRAQVGQLAVDCGFDGGDEGEAGEGGGEVDVLELVEGVEFGGFESADVGVEFSEKSLGFQDQILERGECLVELADGELGVVSRIDT